MEEEGEEKPNETGKVKGHVWGMKRNMNGKGGENAEENK